MRREMLPGIVSALAVLLQGAPLRANTDIGETGFSFLNLGTGARLEALAAGTVLAEGADALAWNPAITARATSPSASASWFNWMTGIQAGHVAGFLPLARGSIGFTATSLSVTDFTNVAGEPTIGESDLALVQAMGVGIVDDLAHLRAIVRASFETERFEPAQTSPWDDAQQRFDQICGATS